MQRQYTGTAGWGENAQIGVFLSYASLHGRALIDRRLYLPQTSWCADAARCAAAGVPKAVGLATKPQLAADMITEALDAGVPAAWVAADEVYGANPAFGARLHERGVDYVLAVACDQRATHRRTGLLPVLGTLSRYRWPPSSPWPALPE